MEQLMESPLLLAGAAVVIVLAVLAAIVVYFLYLSPPPSAEGATSPLTLKLRTRRPRGPPPRVANVSPADATSVADIPAAVGIMSSPRLALPWPWSPGQPR